MTLIVKSHKHGNRWHPESCAPRTEIRRLYVDKGLSTRQIAAYFGLSKSYIYELCKDLARSPSQAAILRQPSTSTHWRSSRAAARKIMERHLGRKLSSDEHVHHKDRDYRNNSLMNLEVLSAKEHHALHQPMNPVPRHLRLERRTYMQRYFETYWINRKEREKNASSS